MRGDMRFLYVAPWHTTIAVPPKNGSSSVYEAMAEAFDVDHINESPHVFRLKRLAVPPSAKLVFVTRGPLDRFQSLWRNKCYAGGRLNGHDLKGMTPRELFDYIKTHENQHWTRQVDLLGDLRGHPNLDLVPLDGLTRYWRDHIDSRTPLGQLNAASKLHDPEDIDSVAVSVAQHYAEDLELHRDACEEYERGWKR